MSGIGVLGAFLGGLASLLSPCSALLLPSFFAYAFDRVQVLIRRSIGFWLGLCAVLVPLGAGIGGLGRALTEYRSVLILVGALVLIGFGALTVLGRGFSVPGMQRMSGRINVSSTLSVVALGAVYGLAGFCAGPLLGAVLTMSALGANPVYGGLLMAVYALGMVAPLFLLAWLWERYNLGAKRWLRGRPVRLGPLHTHTTALLSGTVLIVIGILFLLTDGTANLGGLLSVDTEFGLQVWLRRMSTAVADPVVLLIAVLGVLAWRVYRWRRPRGGSRPEPAAITATDDDPRI